MKMYLGRKPANAEGRLKKASKNGIQALDAGKRPKFRKSDRNGEKFVAEIVSKRRDRESKLDSVKDSLTSRKWAVQKKLATGKFTIDAKPKGLGAGRRTPDDVTGKNKGKTRLKNVILEDEKPKGKLARSSPSGTVKKFSKIRVSEMDDREGKGRKVHNKTEDRTHKIERNSASREKSQKEAGEMVPKKSKRVIRIDPHDISNKRVDDGPTAANAMQKVPDKETNLSQNAQFRAIKPSKEILSFVEDNLLGRRRLIELRRAGYNVDISAPLDNIPFSTSTERERIEDNVFRNKLTFFAAAKVSSSFPPAEIPEIAFAGRSNVGKSSLLNALTRQWGVVRTSDKPGLTQTINFFKLASKLCLVDLPGYGFAYAKEEVKDSWEELVKEYVSTRVGVRRVCLLIDTKRGMKPRDHELISLMERSQTKYQIVLTKTDTVFPLDVARHAMQIQEGLKKNKSIVEPVMMASSKSGAGIRSLRAILSKIVRVAKI